MATGLPPFVSVIFKLYTYVYATHWKLESPCLIVRKNKKWRNIKNENAQIDGIIS